MLREIPSCPFCYSETVGTLIYPYKGKELISRYCPKCDEWKPSPRDFKDL